MTLWTSIHSSLDTLDALNHIKEMKVILGSLDTLDDLNHIKEMKVHFWNVSFNTQNRNAENSGTGSVWFQDACKLVWTFSGGKMGAGEAGGQVRNPRVF